MNGFRQIPVNVQDLVISENELFDILRENNDPDQNPMADEIRDVFRLLPEICDIRGGYVIYPSAKAIPEENKLSVHNTVFPVGKRISRYMKGMEEIAILICTAGEKFTSCRDEYNSNYDYLKGFVVDTLGSLVVEKAMEHLQSHLRKEMNDRGLNITNRYSPGYCEWPLATQQDLFTLLPPNDCRITLTKSSLMIPLKSVSGIIGIGKSVQEKKYTCNICNNTTCIYRQVRMKSQV